MKVAIATDGNMVAGHFGRCQEYTTYQVEDGQVSGRMVVPNPGHEPGFLPRYLAGMGVKVIMAGGMGPRAQALFDEAGIQTVVGVTGPVDDVIRAFAAGQLQGGDSLCRHGEGRGDGHGSAHDAGRCGTHGQGAGGGCDHHNG